MGGDLKKKPYRGVDIPILDEPDQQRAQFQKCEGTFL